MKITYLGHASIKVESDGKTVFIDPWLNGPTSPIKVSDVNHADIVLVTHDHGDHGYSEAIEICKKTDAFFVAINELGIHAKKEGLKNVHTLNIGGSVNISEIKVTLVQAFHSCEIGAPTGFVVKFNNGTLYHTGDTGFFSSMELIGKLYRPNVVFIPIGGYYTCGIEEATLAIKLIQPQVVIPIHYNTFPVIKVNPDEFKQLVAIQVPDTKVEILAPGDSKEIIF